MPVKKSTTKKSVNKENTTSAPLHIIAVGASAGGLEALQDFLSHLPLLENCCILIAQHLSPTHKSMLVQLLSRETSLSVEEAQDGISLAANRVYITPPDKEITIVHGKIHLAKPHSAIGPKPSVDVLFESIAQAGLAPFTIGIILSGTGSDGATGTIALKKGGGHLIAQEPETAKYNGMPLAAIQTGMVDAVLAPEKMGEEIQGFLADPLQLKVVKQNGSETASALAKIFSLLGKRTGSDFSNYKSATIERRLEKRMAMIKVSSVEEYLKVLEQHPKEIDEMFNMILIGVTTFFRDMEAFAALEDHLRTLIKSKITNDPIRIWIPGCSTGEEAYSIAILLTRILSDKTVNYRVQIFATDIDDRAISFARKGVYSAPSLGNLPPEIKDQYFVQNGNEFELIKTIRSMVLFSKHDVLRNPPFLKLDLISCRNLLIYFNAALQDQVIPIFHYALHPDALLFLGKAETVGGFTDLFATVDTHNKIYQRKRGGSLKNMKLSAFKSQQPTFPKNKLPDVKRELSTQDLVKETLFQTYEHPYVVVNEVFDIVEVNGDVRLFLSLTAGGIHVNLVKMLNPELQIEVRSLLSKTMKERIAVKGSIKQFELFGGRHFVRIQAKPLLFSAHAAELFVVIFEILEIHDFVAKGGIEKKEELVNNRIAELEQELAATKEQLQTYIEEIETTNEELQSLNEEMQSTNEELQSSNEELETANEELQSTNEEVQIAYTELKNANDELERKEFQLLLTQAGTNALLNNKLQAFVLVDSTYKILRFNESAIQLFLDLRGKELQEGESIIDFVPAGQVETFIHDFAVAAGGKVFQTEKELSNTNGSKRWIAVNYSPVALGAGEVAGVSLGMLDITALKLAISELNATEQLVNSVFNAVSTGICITDERGIFADVNDEYCRIYGYTRDELIGQHFSMMVAPPHRKMMQQLHDDFIGGGNETPADFEVLTKSGAPIKIAVSADLLVQPDGRRFKVTSIRDISEQVKLQEDLKSNEKRFRALVENGADAVVILGADGRPKYVSASISKVLGYSEEEALALNLFDIVHPDDLEPVAARMKEVLACPGVPMPGYTSRGKHKDGSWRWLEATITNMLDDPIINGIVDNFRDVTQRVEAELKLKNSEEKYRYIFNLSPLPKWIYNLETFRIVEVNIAAEKHYGYSRDEFLSMTILELYPVTELAKLERAHADLTATDGLIQFGKFIQTKKDGIALQADVSGRSIQYDGKNCMSVVCVDVTEINELQDHQKQLLHTLEQRNNFIERVIEELPIGIAVNRITDGEATIINKAFGKTYGWSNTEMVDVQSFFEKVYPDEIYRQEIMKAILEDIKTGDPNRMQWNNIMVTAKNGEKRYVNAKNIPLPDQNLMISTVIDVTNEYTRTTAIKASEARLSEAQAVAKVGSWETDLETLNVTWSEETFRIFELDPSFFQSSHPAFLEYVHPEDQLKVNAGFEASFSNNSENRVEHRIITKTGVVKNVEERWKIVRDDTGKPVLAVGTCQDITERIRSEEKIKESNRRYEYVTKATFDAIWDWNLLTGDVFWSDAYNELFGDMEAGELDDMHKVKQRLHPSELEMILKSAAEALASTEQNWELEHRYLRSDGTYAFVQNKAVIIRDQELKPLRVIGAMQDITVRKLKEQQLKLMESVITNTTDAVLITLAEPLQAPGPAIVYVNDAFTRMTGYTADEVVGKTPRILQGPKSDRTELNRLRHALGKWEACEITTVNYKKNGEEFWINMTISPVADANGWFTHWIAIERDVTRQKMQELQKQLLAEISRLFNQDTRLKPTLEIVLENLVKYADINLGEAWLLSADKKSLNLIGFYTTDERSKLFYKETENIKSFAMGNGLPGTVWKEQKIIMWDSVEMRAEYVRRQAAENAGFTASLGIPLLHNDEVVGVLVFMTANDSQNLHQYKNLFTELETFLGAELKRKHLEEELNQIFNTAPDIICLADFEGFFKRMNAAGCKLLGYTEEELLNKPFYELVHPDDLIDSTDAVNRLAVGENIVYFENRYFRKDGSMIWLSWTCNSSVEDGLIYAVAKDTTETKQLQQLLDKANQLASIGSWEFDLITKELYWSDITRQIHEVEEDYNPQIDTGTEFYKVGESRTRIKSMINAAIEKGEAWDEELQLTTAKGNERWVRVIGSPEFNEGSCVRIYGSFQNITERKKGEIDLQLAFTERNSILESIGDAFFAVDTAWVVTYWNKEAEILLQTKREEIVGKNLWDVFKDAKGLPSFQNYHRAMESRENISFDDYYAPVNRWFEISAYPSVNGLSVYFKDVSIRKQAEEQIRQSNERFEKVTEATNDAIWDYDVENDSLFWGKGFYSMFGYIASEVKPSFDLLVSLIHTEDRDRVSNKVYQYMMDPTLSNWFEEYRFLKADGNYALIIDRATFLRDEKGKVLRVVGAMTDITYRKEYEESLRQLNSSLDQRAKELAISNAELEQFAYVASHDLQEPLRMVTSFLTQVDKRYSSVLDDKGRQYIHFAVDGAKRMRQIILDLLEYSRIGRAGSNPEKVVLNELIEEIKFLFKRQTEEKEAVITHDPLPVLFSHRSPLRQLFQNLVGNALKYSHPERRPEIHISFTETETQVEFCVRDNGIGIDKEYFEKIFIIFQRLHNKDEYSGTGMGLSISKKIVESLGGKIWVNSTEGEGSSFYFTLAKSFTR